MTLQLLGFLGWDYRAALSVGGIDGGANICLPCLIRVFRSVLCLSGEGLQLRNYPSSARCVLSYLYIISILHCTGLCKLGCSSWCVVLGMYQYGIVLEIYFECLQGTFEDQSSCHNLTTPWMTCTNENLHKIEYAF